MKLTCSIIDDEPLAIELLEEYVHKTDFLILKGKYTDATLAMKDIMKDAPDFIFLDIHLQGINGVELSKRIGDKTKVIFTTAYDKYAIDGYKVNAVDYLLKPISYSDFINAVQKVQSVCMRHHPQDNTYEQKAIFVHSEYKLLQIKIKDILFIEGLKDYLKIYVEGEPSPILSLNTMKAMENTLPGEHFARVHRSFIVNKDKIKVIERNRIVFGKNYIPISDTYKDEFMDFINKRML